MLGKYDIYIYIYIYTNSFGRRGGVINVVDCDTVVNKIEQDRSLLCSLSDYCLWGRFEFIYSVGVIKK